MDCIKKAKNEIECYLQKNGCSPARLPPSVVQKFPAKYDLVAGWEIDSGIFIDHTPLLIYLLIDSSEPFPEIRFAINKQNKLFLKWPHVEETGCLCFTTPSKRANQSTPEYIKNALESVSSFINEIRAGKRDDHFIEEFASYWTQEDTNYSSIKFTSSISLSDKPERVIAIDIQESDNLKKSGKLIARNKSEAIAWAKNYSGKNLKAKKLNIQKAFIIWVDDYPLIPENYPKTIADVLDIVQECTPHLLQEIESSIWTEKKDTVLLLAVRDSKEAYGLGGISLKCPTLGNGFRKNIEPVDTIKQLHYSQPNKYVLRHRVARAEPEWIHGRYTNPHISTLRQKSVCFIGCGSLGAGVIKLCASGGIGNITIIDYDTLSWANTGRHELGAYAVGRNKAKVMHNVIASSFPHITVESHDKSFEEAYKESPEFFNKFDLIISTTGNWKTEYLLNKLIHSQENFPPVLLGWLEQFALAGHTLIIEKSKNDLMDYFVAKDQFNYSILDPTIDTQRREVACGNYFQPYGYIETTATQSLIANSVLEFLLNKCPSGYVGCWIGYKKHFDDGGVSLTPHGQYMIDKHGYGKQIPRPHPKPKLCETA